jgi:hypothetical protein
VISDFIVVSLVEVIDKVLFGWMCASRSRVISMPWSMLPQNLSVTVMSSTMDGSEEKTKSRVDPWMVVGSVTCWAEEVFLNLF